MNDEHRQTSTFDSGISIRLAGLVLAALIGVFVLRQLGFRFVVSASSAVGA